MSAGELPEPIIPLSWLIGSWVGVGTGQYPSIDDFRFGQEAVFRCDGRPFLSYFSRTWMLDDDGNRVRPLGTEAGFWRPRPDNHVEVTLAHPTGYAEIWYGVAEGPRITLGTDVVARTQTAVEYTAGQRMYGLVEGALMYAVDKAAEGQGMQSHLWGKLARV